MILIRKSRVFGYLAVSFFLFYEYSPTRSFGTQQHGMLTQDFAIDLTDGSHIIGSPAISALTLHASFGKVEIPLKQLRTIKFQDDHERVHVFFLNGDRLTGVADFGSCIQLQTLMGKISLCTEHIKNIAVVRRMSLPSELRKALVLYFPFDKDEQKVADYSGTNNHGRNHGAALTPNGMVNGAFQFNGNAYVICQDNPTLDLTDQLTIMFWAKLGPPVNGYAAQIIHKASPCPLPDAMIAMYYLGTRRTANPGLIQPHATIDGEWGGLNGFIAEQDVWYHLAVTYDGEAFIFYKDSKQVSVRDRKGKLATNNQPLFIGKRWGPDHGRAIHGTIDELMIFNRALSSQQIKQLYIAQASITVSPSLRDTLIASE